MWNGKDDVVFDQSLVDLLGERFGANDPSDEEGLLREVTGMWEE